MNTDKDLSSPAQLAANSGASSPPLGVPSDIERIALEIHALAERVQDNPLALLQLLRTIEQVHRDIQVDYFQSALPDSRQALYALLRDIEENGGWPYIQRWKLQALFANLSETER